MSLILPHRTSSGEERRLAIIGTTREGERGRGERVSSYLRSVLLSPTSRMMAALFCTFQCGANGLCAPIAITGRGGGGG